MFMYITAVHDAQQTILQSLSIRAVVFINCRKQTKTAKQKDVKQKYIRDSRTDRLQVIVE